MSSPPSSAAWSDSGDEAADQNASASTSTAMPALPAASTAATTRPRHGERAAFQPPPGYLPSYFSNELTSTFGYDTLKRDQQKQLWVVKIPEGVSASALDGLVIDVSAPSGSSLADISIPVKIRGEVSSQGQSKRYSLRRRGAAAMSKKQDMGGSTQLIMMAGGSKALSADKDESNEQEREAFRVLVPHSSSAGRYVFAPKAIEQSLHLVLDDDAAASVADKQAASIPTPAPNGSTSTAQKRKREQPTAKLNGRFMPSGSRTEEKDTKDTLNDATPVKAKKSKKVKAEGEAQVEESKPKKTSASPKKSKKSTTPTKQEA